MLPFYKIWENDFTEFRKVTLQNSDFAKGFAMPKRLTSTLLTPQSLLETGDSSGLISLEALCQGEWQEQMTGEVSLPALIELVLRGGLPGMPASVREARALIHERIDRFLDDVSTGSNDSHFDRRKMEKVLCTLAKLESTATKPAAILRHVEEVEPISRPTLTAYLDLFARHGLTNNLPAFSPAVSMPVRLKQTEELHLCDPSVAAALLDLDADALLNNLTLFKRLFHALCVRDLRLYAEKFGAKVSHYQDYNNRSMDAVIEMPDGSWIGVAIVLGMHEMESAATKLLRLRKSLARNAPTCTPARVVVICGVGNASYIQPDNVGILALTSLKY